MKFGAFCAGQDRAQHKNRELEPEFQGSHKHMSVPKLKKKAWMEGLASVESSLSLGWPRIVICIESDLTAKYSKFLLLGLKIESRPVRESKSTKSRRMSFGTFECFRNESNQYQ